MTAELSQWWYLDLAADFPQLEIHTGHGWGPKQELAQIELGERVMEEETFWLFTWIYSTERDRCWAAAMGMLRMVCDWIRRERPEAEQVIQALKGLPPETVSEDEIPAGWFPDVEIYSSWPAEGQS